MVRCYSCFHENRDDFTVCPNCGRQRICREKSPVSLPLGTKLQNGRYIIGEEIDEGGFGKVYGAWDTKLKYKVAVKEFFISRMMTRVPGTLPVLVNEGNQKEALLFKQRFLAEARTMAQFQGMHNLPRVQDHFEENDTAYIIMEYLEGLSLSKYLEANQGKIGREFALYMASEVCIALKGLHAAGIIHRDVAPDNIFICTGADIRIKLLDLGAARLANATDEVIDMVMKPGFSPPEQYDISNKKIGPWLDIYALGATLYKSLTNVQPVESTNRTDGEDPLLPPNQIDPTIPENLSNAILKAMAVHKPMRFTKITDFQDAINGQRKVLPLKEERHRRKIRWISGLVASSVLVTASALACLHIYRDKRTEGVLSPAELSVWFRVAEGSGEKAAMESVQEDFEAAYPDVRLNLRAIASKEYNETLQAAADSGKLPDLFESTGLSKEILTDCRDLGSVMETEQFQQCLFLDQYDRYYADQKRMPLAIEVPMAYVITNGSTSLNYQAPYFDSLEAFGDQVNISADSWHQAVIRANFDTEACTGRGEFLEPTKNTSPVLLSSSMAMNEIRETLVNYEKNFVYYNADEIHCRFIYEWSIGATESSEIAAAERLLSWMLGNIYQTTLMTTECNNGEIPVNQSCFKAKIQARNLQPISEIYQNFVFDREEKSK